MNLFSNVFAVQVFSPELVVTNLTISFLLSAIIAYMYKSTHRGLSYSQAYVINLILVGIVITSVMMVIGNNVARAFGAFGAFSLIRFRTAIKDPRDMAYIFLTLGMGMAVGTNNYIIAITTTIFIVVIVYGLTKVNFGSIRKFDYVLKFTLETEDGGRTDVYQDVFAKFLKYKSLLNINTLRGGKAIEFSFSARFFNDEERGDFVNELNQVKGISQINLLAAKNDIEY